MFVALFILYCPCVALKIQVDSYVVKKTNKTKTKTESSYQSCVGGSKQGALRLVKHSPTPFPQPRIPPDPGAALEELLDPDSPMIPPTGEPL